MAQALPFWDDDKAPEVGSVLVRDFADPFNSISKNARAYRYLQLTSPWDQVLLQPPGERGWLLLPGLGTVKIKRGEKLDVKPAPGTNGATITLKGYEPAKVTIELLLWSEGDWVQLQRVLPLIEPRPGKSVPDRVQIMHPAAKVRNVNSIIIEDIDGPDAKGVGMGLTISGIEWVPQASAGAGSATKTPGSGALTGFTVDQNLPTSRQITPTIGEGTVSRAVADIFNTQADRAKP